jgi:hypothetical protein
VLAARQGIAADGKTMGSTPTYFVLLDAADESTPLGCGEYEHNPRWII